MSKTLFYFSGSCGAAKGGFIVADPEVVFEESTLMLSYHHIKHRGEAQHIRFDLIRQDRKRRKKKKGKPRP